MKKLAILISTTISLQAFTADYETDKEKTVRLSKQEIRKNNIQIENEIKKRIEEIIYPVSKYELQKINYISDTEAEVIIGKKVSEEKNTNKGLILKFLKEKGNWIISEQKSKKKYL
ncbi:MAG: hypothetical protein Q4D53_02200 [Leptotrichiaceae bacterium]|nr:hypothetical protein [Leptotrichiaceae bacterium]